MTIVFTYYSSSGLFFVKQLCMKMKKKRTAYLTFGDLLKAYEQSSACVRVAGDVRIVVSEVRVRDILMVVQH